MDKNYERGLLFGIVTTTLLSIIGFTSLVNQNEKTTSNYLNNLQKASLMYHYYEEQTRISNDVEESYLKASAELDLERNKLQEKLKALENKIKD